MKTITPLVSREDIVCGWGNVFEGRHLKNLCSMFSEVQEQDILICRELSPEYKHSQLREATRRDWQIRQHKHTSASSVASLHTCCSLNG